MSVETRLCGCWARRHSLIANCRACGRVACEREGEGPCLFCGNPVFAGKAAAAEEQLAAAERLKKKLLRGDKEDARKGIIDEEIDWYELERDVWLDPSVRREAGQRAAEEAAAIEKGGEMVLGFDSEGRLETKLQKADAAVERKAAREFFAERARHSPSIENAELSSVFAGVAATYSAFEPAPRRLAALDEADEPIIDEQLFDIKKWGDYRCLSLGSLRARLIVEGVRCFEPWPSDLKFRGPIFIHSNIDAEPDAEILLSLYADLLPNGLAPFAGGRLVGVVDLQDVWPSALYRERVPPAFAREDGDAFVLVFRNPRRFAVPLRLDVERRFGELSAASLGPTLNHLIASPSRGGSPFARAFEAELRANERFVRISTLIAHIAREERRNGLVEFVFDAPIFESALVRVDGDFGKTLKQGYESRKRISLKQYTELLFPFWYFARRAGGQTPNAAQLSADVFRLGRPTPIAFHRSYLVLVAVGAAVQFGGAAAFQLKSDNLVALGAVEHGEWRATPIKESARALSGTGEHLSAVFAVFGD